MRVNRSILFREDSFISPPVRDVMVQMGGTRFAPPLIGSDWVLGNEKRLVLLVLHGMEGPVEVNGKLYDAPDILPVMPAQFDLG